MNHFEEKLKPVFVTQSNPSSARESKNPPVDFLIQVQIQMLPDMNSFYSSKLENPPVEFIFW